MSIEVKIAPLKQEFFDLAWKRLDNLIKPLKSLGRLEEIAAQLVAIFKGDLPKQFKKIVLVFAGDHGVVEEGVSAYPKEVTPQMVFNFLRGTAGINVLARHAGADVWVTDVGVDYEFKDVPGLISKKVVYGTKNFVKEPALTRDEAIKCIKAGMEVAFEAIDKGYNLIAIGDMGIGNTTPSAAITSVITGKPVEEVTGRGTGIPDELLKKKMEVIKKGIELHKPNPDDGIDVLSKVGGAEIGACAGVILACASRGIPVVVDGFITSAGALIAHKVNPLVKDYMFFGHQSQEKGHKAILEYFHQKPLLDLNLRLGEGTGAALGMFLVEAALKIYKEMLTFEEAGVSTSVV